MKKFKFIRAIAIVSAISLAISGCGTNNTKKTAGNIKLTENGAFPIVEEPVTLSVLTGASTYVEDYTTNDFTKYYEEKTNVKIDWQIVSGELNQKLNVIVASGNYPDIFLSCTIKKPAQAQYGRDGVIIPLNDLIDKNTKWIKEVMDRESYIKEQLTAPDGKIYGLPQYSPAFHSRTSSKMWIYEPWLKKSGVEMPKTTDEFKQFLIKVRDGDFNANSNKDEIPLLGIGTRDTIKYLMNSFTYMDDYEDFDFFVENGKVLYSPVQEGFKEGLKYIQNLYKEGLIAKESFVIDRQQRTATVENPDAPLVACAPALWYGQFTVNNGGTGRYADFTSVPPLKGPSGRQAVALRNPLVDGQTFSISSSCRNPEVAIRWVDYFFSKDGNLEVNYGKENQTWRKAKEGEVNAKGEQAYSTMISKTEFGETQNDHWVQLAPTYREDKMEFGFSVDEKAQKGLEVRLYNESLKYEPFIENKTLPDMFYDEQIVNEYSTLKNAVFNATYQAVADMILNNVDIDNEWNSYLAKLKGQGLDRYIEIQQMTYDKYKK